MAVTNAFIGKTEQPSPEELTAALGPSEKLWQELVQWMATKLGATTQEWKGVVPKKYGWSLRLKIKARNIVYLGPSTGCFSVGFVLGDRALKAAKETHLPAGVMQAIASAPRYPEGTGLRLVVKTARDLPAIHKLAEIKVAH
ncbi:MAG TPA: DUF3788 family protein [Terracidiphilus sp.]|nr:DUF3788 family protein [Terracidiphilus sp.]